MKKLMLLFAMFFFVFSYGFAQKENKAPKDVKHAPEIEFDVVMIDAGNINYGEDGVFEFIYTNIGKEVLIISNVSTSCGCAVPVWSTEPLAKKNAAVLTIRYDTKRIGPFVKTATVSSNAINSPVILTIKGNVVPPINNK